ncbi:MAG: class II aldolase/adducin family protein [Oscillibacter sp.]|nr:class II aldolase/adducin family protein [Oscillibacter sp.]
MKDKQKIREEMVALCLESFHEGLFTGTSGNLSVYLKEEGLMLITPTSVRYDVMRPEDIVLCDLEGNIAEGHLNPSSEWRMHAIVYKNYPDTGSVFHTHSPYATAFAVVHKAIPATLIETHFFLGGTVECAAYATPGTDGVGLNAVPALKGKGGCLLANHGVLAVGMDMQQAKLRAEYIEDSAKIYQYACALGTPVVLDQL